MSELVTILLDDELYRHERELQAAMMREGDTLTDRDINTLTRQHVMEKEVLDD